MKAKNLILLIAVAFTAAACTRPAEVRRVAELSKPIAVEIQRSGGQLETRMAVQAQAFDRNAASLAIEAGRARNHTQMIERDMRLLGDKASLEKLAMMREGDAALLADPLSPLAVTAPPAPAPRQSVDLGALTKAVAGLDRMTGADRMTAGELVSFLRDVNSELRKLEAEGASQPPAAPEGGASPPQ